MTISFEEINRTLLRVVFLPWFKRSAEDFGIILPADWNPSDEELAQLAVRIAAAFQDVIDDGSPRPS